MAEPPSNGPREGHADSASPSLSERLVWLQAVVDHTTAVIYIKDANFRYLFINKRYERLFGISCDWIVGRSDEDLFSPEKAAELRANDRRVLELGESIQFEENVPHGGEMHAYISVKFPIRGPDGTIAAVGGISTDITRRKRTEERLAHQTQVLRSVLDSMAEGVLVADEDRHISLINPAAERMFGLGPNDLGRQLGYRPADIYHADMQTPIAEVDLPLERSLRGDEVNELEVFVRRPDPPFGFWGLVNGRPVRDHHGRARGAVIVYRDVSDAKANEQRLRDQNARLEETVASERAAHRALAEAEAHLIQSEKLSSLGQMVAGVAHEINNPLAYVASNLTVLQRDLAQVVALVAHYRAADTLLAAHQPELHERIAALTQHHDLDYVVHNLDRVIARSAEGVRRIQQIVQDLRTFARLDEGSVQVADINEGIRLTLNIVHGRAIAQNVELSTELSSLPLVTCQASRINQVVLNLLGNAIDACASGGRVTVRTRLGADGRSVEVEVEDDGVGIDPGIQAKIFDPFFTTKPVGRGTGLGLAITYGIVRDHGGSVQVKSTLGKGSRFTVRLPIGPVRT